MIAAVRGGYGPPEVLSIQEVERPEPRSNEVLVQVVAASLKAADLELLTGKPLYARIYGLLTPRHQIIGSDIAGRVVAVGSRVTRFQPGDTVLGDLFEHFGAFAEYVCAPEETLTPKPAELTFHQAAALPESGCIAFQGIRAKGRVGKGDTVLINGAGGGAGTLAVQLAASLGAKVTGVDSPAKGELVLSLGAHHYLDYTCQDFTALGRRYDLILDLSARHPLGHYRRALRPGGAYYFVGGSMSVLMQLLCLGPWIRAFTGKRMRVLAVKTNDGLDDVLALVRAGTLRPIVDRIYPLGQIGKALRYLQDGRALGKVVIDIAGADD